MDSKFKRNHHSFQATVSSRDVVSVSASRFQGGLETIYGRGLVSDGLANALVSVSESRVSVLVSVSDSEPRAHRCVDLLQRNTVE